ncbi:3',5'-cyclic AMP phosphodiesterase CpdA [Paracoccus alcaliphilus]|uniref:3',5'-cyclic AMP phosphodiesterase CpdA n=1 Tax=Paracoccus alcaliphilus TaxID=34002 RepID=A0A1H8DX39_9RHOB|nr:metallophosphoesterase [Paracoccus alcaliphilus]WCR16877.1 metallophosphoesterase [Paracoccus alcaliphilus]SEN11773.1 3',5'-cyclic AMP phosphodiesterase CpdA [Paracoccus alcaliphilus]
MTRILHLSDLHFGFHRRALTDDLLHRVNDVRADLVVVTGDVTHRAKPAQYARAAQFLKGIETDWIAMPGNHDVPLFNPLLRLLRPWARFRQTISDQLAPSWRSGNVQVLALNSADPFAIQRGVLRRGQVAAAMARINPDLTNIVALHHPLQHRPGVDKNLARRAALTLEMLESVGAQIVLSGHLHVWSAGALLDPVAGGRVLQIQAGTALCARPGDMRNEFCVLDIRGPELTIERHVAPMDHPGFLPPEYLHFSRVSGRWHPGGHDPDQETEPLPTEPGATDTALSTAKTG